jgi:Domain of unknown function (DUF4386)
MTTRTAETSPLVYARIAGILAILLVVLGPFSLIYVPSTLIVPGDATATADNIRASESLFRTAIISDLVIFFDEIVLTVLLYVLLRPVSRTLSLVAAFARLSMAVIQGINQLPSLIVLLLLSGAGYFAAFEPSQLDALVLLFLNAREYGVYIWQSVFVLHLVVLGYLVFKSGYFPRVLGVLLILGALGYLTDSIGNILFPNYEPIFGVVVAVTSIIGELPFFLWLLIKGVNVQKWHDRASAAP